MSKRPDYVCCIAHANADRAGTSWCRRRLASEFHFLSVDHAALNGEHHGRLVACPACLTAVTAALRNGYDPTPESDHAR